MATVPSRKGKPAPKPAESKSEYKTVLKVCSCECEGCKKKVKEILTKIEGVRTVGIDFMQQEVKVVVVGNVDSKTLINKLKTKTGKQAALWLQEGDQKQNKQENGKSEPKSSGEEEKEAEWVLKVPLHCEIGCQNDVEKALKKIEGVHTVHIDKQGKVTVVGNVDFETLKEELKNKLRKHSELWPQEGDQKQKELKGNSTNNAVEGQGRGSRAQQAPPCQQKGSSDSWYTPPVSFPSSPVSFSSSTSTHSWYASPVSFPSSTSPHSWYTPPVGFPSSTWSPSHVSPAEEAGLIALLKDKSVDELRKLLSDKDAFNQFLLSVHQVKTLRRDQLCKEILQLQISNVEKEAQVMELRKLCMIMWTRELVAAQEKLKELERQKEEIMKFFSPASSLDRPRGK